MTLLDLPTPCLLLDHDRLAANCDRMKARARRSGVRLRPHLKTLKCTGAAELAVDDSRAVAVSTLTEAEFFARQGFADILVAVCLPAAKAGRALAFGAAWPGTALSVPVEDEAVARSFIDAAGTAGGRLGVWIEVDCGEHRTGFDPDSPALVRTVQHLLRSPAIDFRGVMTHAGQSYRCRDADAVREVAGLERDAAVYVAGRLAASGLPCPDLSVGSTPTAVFGSDWAGVTELRPGVYMAGDLFQRRLGAVGPADIALSVLSTVISSHPGRCVIDAGGLALSKDRSLLGEPDDPGFGEVLSLDGRATGLHVHDVHQEHGEIRLPDGFDLPVGTRVRVLPVHACMTAAAHAGYHVVQGGEVVARWPRANGWD